MKLVFYSEQIPVLFTVYNDVNRLCSRDPHQLFLRLESQVRERVFEKKRHLSEKLNVGYSTPPEAREIMSTLLSEYVQLCSVSRLVSEHLTDLVSGTPDIFLLEINRY